MFNKHCLVFLGIILANVISLPTAKAEVAIVVNSANSSVLSDSDLARLFLGKLKSFPDGDKAEPINQKFGNDIRKEFEQKVLGKSASQVKAYWSKQVFSGKGQPPHEEASDKDILNKVANDKTAIGYVDSTSVDGSVKVVKKF